MRGVRNEARRVRLREQWGKVSVQRIAKEENTSAGAIYRLAREMGLTTKARKYSPLLNPAHKAVRAKSTRYPKTIMSAKLSKRVLVGGDQNRKLGSRVAKGRLKGLPIYALTLIERTHCPTSCTEWLGCYGNSMNWARRHRLDAELIKRLDVELDMVAAQHPKGFLLRLHTLGDFGADAQEGLPYVDFWRRRMGDTPALHIFGFTAHTPDSEVGRAIMRLNVQFSTRFWIRFSGTENLGGYSSRVIEREEDARHVVCPVEAKKSESCGTCGLCWSMRRPVEFVRH